MLPATRTPARLRGAGHAEPRRREQWRHLRRPGPLVAISLIYVVALSALMVWRGISVSPDYLLVILVPVALLSGRASAFFADWVPFVVLFLAWEAMRGVAARTGFAPHIADLAALEQGLFGGHLPTAVLQGWIHSSVVGRAFDVAATGVYLFHFVLPIVVGMGLWLTCRPQFLRFSAALFGMAFAAFVVFLLFPAAPPWYAEAQGVVTGVQKIIGQTLPSAVSPYYASLNPNLVAAMPSLHAAFPFLGFLAVRQVHRAAARFVLGWCFMVWFSIIYLGEHYVIDAVAGVFFAWAAWSVTMRVAVPRMAALRVRPTVVAAVRDEALVA